MFTPCLDASTAYKHVPFCHLCISCSGCASTCWQHMPTITQHTVLCFAKPWTVIMIQLPVLCDTPRPTALAESRSTRLTIEGSTLLWLKLLSDWNILNYISQIPFEQFVLHLLVTKIKSQWTMPLTILTQPRQVIPAISCPTCWIGLVNRAVAMCYCTLCTYHRHRNF